MPELHPQRRPSHCCTNAVVARCCCRCCIGTNITFGFWPWELLPWYDYNSASGKHFGMFPKIFDALAEEMGLTFNYVPYDASRSAQQHCTHPAAARVHTTPQHPVHTTSQPVHTTSQHPVHTTAQHSTLYTTSQHTVHTTSQHVCSMDACC